MIFILLMLAVMVFLVLAIVLVAAVAAGTWLGAVIGWLAAGCQGEEKAGGHVPAKPPLWKVALGTIAGGLLGGLVGLGLTLLWIVMEFSAG